MGFLRGLWVYQLNSEDRDLSVGSGNKADAASGSGTLEGLDNALELPESQAPRLLNLAALRYTAAERRMTAQLVRERGGSRPMGVAKTALQEGDPSVLTTESDNDWASIPSEPEFTALFRSQLLSRAVQVSQSNHHRTRSSPATVQHTTVSTAECPTKMVECFCSATTGSRLENHVLTRSHDGLLASSWTTDEAQRKESSYATSREPFKGTSHPGLALPVWPYGPLGYLVSSVTPDNAKKLIYPVLYATYGAILVVAVPYLTNLDFSKRSCYEVMCDPRVYATRPSLSRCIEVVQILAEFVSSIMLHPFPSSVAQKSVGLPADVQPVSPETIERIRQMMSLVIPFGRLVAEDAQLLRQYMWELWAEDWMTLSASDAKRSAKKRADKRLISSKDSVVVSSDTQPGGRPKEDVPQSSLLTAHVRGPRSRSSDERVPVGPKSLLYGVWDRASDMEGAGTWADVCADESNMAQVTNQLHVLPGCSGVRGAGATSEDVGRAEDESCAAKGHGNRSGGPTLVSGIEMYSRRVRVAEEVAQLGGEKRDHTALQRVKYLMTSPLKAATRTAAFNTPGVSTTTVTSHNEVFEETQAEPCTDRLPRKGTPESCCIIHTIASPRLPSWVPELTAVSVETYMKWCATDQCGEARNLAAIMALAPQLRPEHTRVVRVHPLHHLVREAGASSVAGNTLSLHMQQDAHFRSSAFLGHPCPTGGPPAAMAPETQRGSQDAARAGFPPSSHSGGPLKVVAGVPYLGASLWDFRHTAHSTTYAYGSPVLSSATRKHRQFTAKPSDSPSLGVEFVETVVSYDFGRIGQQLRKGMPEVEGPTLLAGAIRSTHPQSGGPAPLIVDLEVSVQLPVHPAFRSWLVSHWTFPSGGALVVDSGAYPDAGSEAAEEHTPSALVVALTTPKPPPFTVSRYTSLALPPGCPVVAPVRAVLRVREAAAASDKWKASRFASCADKFPRESQVFLDVHLQLDVLKVCLPNVGLLHVEIPLLQHSLGRRSSLSASRAVYVEQHTLEAQCGALQLAGRNTKIMWNLTPSGHHRSSQGIAAPATTASHSESEWESFSLVGEVMIVYAYRNKGEKRHPSRSTSSDMASQPKSQGSVNSGAWETLGDTHKVRVAIKDSFCLGVGEGSWQGSPTFCPAERQFSDANNYYGYCSSANNESTPGKPLKYPTMKSFAEIVYSVANYSSLGLHAGAASASFLHYPDLVRKETNSHRRKLETIQWIEGKHIVFNAA